MADLLGMGTKEEEGEGDEKSEDSLSSHNSDCNTIFLMFESNYFRVDCKSKVTPNFKFTI